MRLRTAPLLLVAVCLLTTGCKKDASGEGPAPVLRLGYFPNVTHGQALVGDHEGHFARAIGQTRLEVKQFNAGPAAMEALVAGSLDVSYVGSGPAINTFLKAGRELRIIAGATNGGAVFVTRTARSAQELKGKQLATPQLGNSQDIALRHWLRTQGLSFGGSRETADVTITPIANADILALFQRGSLEGAWVPEPWAARLIAQGGGQIFIDERTLWPDGKFPTTVLVTTQKFLDRNRATVEALLRAHVELTRQWQADPAAFATRVNAAFAKHAGAPLDEAVLKDAFSRMEPAIEPPAQALQTAAKHAQELGFAPAGDTAGMVSTQLLEAASK